MFSKLASIVSQFSENEVTLDTTFRENKGELNADMGEIAKDLIASQLLVDLEDFDTTPFMNDMTQVKKGLRELSTANQKDLDTLRKECYQELVEEIGDTPEIASLKGQVSLLQSEKATLCDEVALAQIRCPSTAVEHKAYIPCSNYQWAFEITFTRGQKELRYTGIVPLMQSNGTMGAEAPARPSWWNADGNPTDAIFFPNTSRYGLCHQNPNSKMQATAHASQYKMWQFWCKLNNPFSDE